MIKNINFQKSDGYLKSTIDGETIPLELQEIIRKEVTISNRAFTSIPLYEKIPINIFLDPNDDTTIDKGEIDISIVSVDKNNKIIQEYYNAASTFENSYYKTDIQLNIPLGIYSVIINYKGDKYHQPSSYIYKLAIEPRKVLYNFESDEYYGNPLEIINIPFKIYDSITKENLSDFLVYYKYEGITYVTKSNKNGYVEIQIKIPEPTSLCPDIENRTYPIDIRIDNDSYYPSNATIYVRNNKLSTDISFTSDINENSISIHGIVNANNYDDIINVKNGNVVLIIEDDKYNTVSINSEDEGNFEFIVNMLDIHQHFTNQEPYRIQKYDTKVDAYMTISNVSNITVGQKIKPIATLKDKYNNKIIYGMILFELRRNNETLDSKIIEVNNEGSASAEFYILQEGNYNIRCQYHPMFEYKDLEIYHIAEFKVE